MERPDRRRTRRRFLGEVAGAGAAGLAAPAIFGAGRSALGANERIGLGCIGVGKRGSAVLGEFLKERDAKKDVEITAICDVWDRNREPAVKRCGNDPAAMVDFRELLERKDVDAVTVATPPHWHALLVIEACRAGKDVYVEKPMTLTVGESLAVVAAARQHERMTQVGTQMHEQANFRRVVEQVRSGNLGPISVVRTFMVMNQGPGGIGKRPTSDPPAGLDWNLWCGPGPMRPFNPLIVESAYNNCSFMDYSGGWTPGMAPHILDMVYWALDLGYPERVSAFGRRGIIDDDGDCPDTQEALFEYPGLTVTWSANLVSSFGFDRSMKPEIRRRLGVTFQGVNGTLLADYLTHEIVPEGDRMKNAPPVAKSIPDSTGHYRELLDSVRTRRPPSCNVEYHHKIDVAISLANLSMQLGRTLRFDPKKTEIVGDEEATRRLRPVYRAPWRLPDFA